MKKERLCEEKSARFDFSAAKIKAAIIFGAMVISAPAAFSAPYATPLFAGVEEKGAHMNSPGIDIIAAKGKTECAAFVAPAASKPTIAKAPAVGEWSITPAKDFFIVRAVIPKDAKPGIYAGEIAVDAEKLPIALRVLPFELPAPKTHYDTTKEYSFVTDVASKKNWEKGDSFNDYEKLAAKVDALLTPYNADHDTTLRWHLVGARLIDCGSQPLKAEDFDAEFFRRQRGVAPWLANFDGTVIDPAIISANGVLAQEALREAMDDVKYLTLMMQTAEAAEKSETMLVSIEGRKAKQWLSNLNTKTCNLDTMRLEVISFILKLRAVIEEGQGVRVPEIKDVPEAIKRIKLD